MEYKPVARALIKKQQRAVITWIITLQTKHFFWGETIQLVKLILIKNNIRVHNPLIYHTEVPILFTGKTTRPQQVANASHMTGSNPKCPPFLHVISFE